MWTRKNRWTEKNMWPEWRIKKLAEQRFEDEEMKNLLIQSIKKIDSIEDKLEKIKMQKELELTIRNSLIPPNDLAIAENIHLNWESIKNKIKHSPTELENIKNIKEKCEIFPKFCLEIINLAKKEIEKTKKQQNMSEKLSANMCTCPQCWTRREQRKDAEKSGYTRIYPNWNRMRQENKPATTVTKEPIIEVVSSDEESHSEMGATSSTTFNQENERTKNQYQGSIFTQGVSIKEIFSDEENLMHSTVPTKKPRTEEVSFATKASNSEMGATSSTTFNQENIFSKEPIIKEIFSDEENLLHSTVPTFESSTNISPVKQPPTTTAMNWDLYEKSKGIPHTIAATSNTSFVEERITNTSVNTNEQVTQQEINNTVIQNETTSQPSTSSTHRTAHFQ